MFRQVAAVPAAFVAALGFDCLVSLLVFRLDRGCGCFQIFQSKVHLIGVELLGLAPELRKRCAARTFRDNAGSMILASHDTRSF